MGQFALGIRSLVIKSAIFVVMAALLAWTLGGTLFPRAEIGDGPATVWHGANWKLRLSLGGDAPGIVRWSLVRQEGDKKPEPWPLAGFGRWAEAAGPVASESTLYVAFRDQDAVEWTLAAITDNGFGTARLPDRLEVERQFARLRSGLPIQSPTESSNARESALQASPSPPPQPATE